MGYGSVINSLPCAWPWVYLWIWTLGSCLAPYAHKFLVECWGTSWVGRHALVTTELCSLYNTLGLSVDHTGSICLPTTKWLYFSVFEWACGFPRRTRKTFTAETIEQSSKIKVIISDKPLNAESTVNLKMEKEAEKTQLPRTHYLEKGSSRVQVSDIRILAERSFRHDLLSKFP